MRTRLIAAALVLVPIGTGGCSSDHPATPNSGSQPSTSSTMAGRSGSNAPADRTDFSATTTSSGPGRAGATGSAGQQDTGVTGARTDPTTTSTEPYTQR